ncbi:uncharacterized protein LOC131257044 isoform X2 [Magnolia sinica]|uniref:uncharacterized protein LOC131257044 isoform X2 n=1 Tax=Magnolia sinica TaxID=86752 RepID=UPI00265A6202|nr:uncharacterized protein LOC131257044 isoform X2 [Magnolia sinica]
MPAPTLLSRVSAAARSRFLVRPRNKTPNHAGISPSQSSDSVTRISRISRLAPELRCLGSMMPLHSAIASSRLKSNLSAESQSWGWIPQGLSMPL